MSFLMPGTYTSGLAVTEALENTPAQIASQPFYYENSTNKINFGYGINLTDAASNLDAKTEITRVLQISPTQWAQIQNVTPATEQSVIASLGIPTDPVGTVNTLAQYFYNQAASDVSLELLTSPDLFGIPGAIDFNELPSGLQAALTDLQYNTGGSFIGPYLISGLRQGGPRQDRRPDQMMRRKRHKGRAHAANPAAGARSALRSISQSASFDCALCGPRSRRTHAVRC